MTSRAIRVVLIIPANNTTMEPEIRSYCSGVDELLVARVPRPPRSLEARDLPEYRKSTLDTAAIELAGDAAVARDERKQIDVRSPVLDDGADKVGVKAIRHPMKIQERSGGIQHTIATFNMYVGLPHHFKGTHMSRFVEILEAQERDITVETFQQMVR